QRAEPYPFGLQGEPGERGPRVGWLVRGVVGVDAQVVVGAEERVEAALFRRLREVPDLRVGGTVVGFEQDAQPHHRTAFDVVSLPAGAAGPPRPLAAPVRFSPSAGGGDG